MSTAVLQQFNYYRGLGSHKHMTALREMKVLHPPAWLTVKSCTIKKICQELLSPYLITMMIAGYLFSLNLFETKHPDLRTEFSRRNWVVSKTFLFLKRWRSFSTKLVFDKNIQKELSRMIENGQQLHLKRNRNQSENFTCGYQWKDTRKTV